MAKGYHHFYACSIAENQKYHNHPDDYFIGGLVGDKWNDEAFEIKMKKVLELLNKKYGLGNYQYCWSPIKTKPYKPRTQQQRFVTAMKKTSNKHNKKIIAIKNQNYLFGEVFVEEENQKLSKRQDILKKRYNQT